MKRLMAGFLTFFLLLPPTFAGDLVSENPIDRRIQTIATQLRCPVCQGENLFDSHSALAKEMKLIIREKIIEGASDQAILGFFKHRYGDFVLLQPAFNLTNAFLWLSPFAIALIAISIFFLKFKSRSKRIETPYEKSQERETL